MGTFSSVRGARALALLLLALLLHGDAASTNEGLQDAEAELPWPNVTTAEARATELFLYGKFANETGPVSAAIAKRAAAVGWTYGYARWWLSWKCPRRENNGTLSRITRRCYDRGLRSVKAARPRPPRAQESPEEEARRRVVEILTTTTLQVYPWPENIRNPVIMTRYRTYPVPRASKPRFRW